MATTITRIVVSALALATSLATAADFYVAPAGNDANSGSKEKPFAGVLKARDAARAAGAGSHRVVLMTGDYFLTKSLELDARDNGLTIESAAGGMATLYGGRVVAGWRRDGEKFWCADLPGVKEGTWDFRALVVNGRLAERSRVPETGTLVHRSKFDVAVMPAVAGYWARQPTPQERISMEYDPKDISAAFEIRNAELRVYHMWDESLVGIATNDWLKHTFTFSAPAMFPPGAFGIKKYLIFNTREGMTKPGQWYLDRVTGRVFYWPLAGEDMTKVRVIAPVLECVINATGTTKAPVKNLTLRGFALQATTTPLKPAGFGAMQNYDGALHLQQARQCVVEKLDISNAGGLGILARDLSECQIRDCQIHHIGAGGASVKGVGTVVARNHIHHVGIYHPSAAALSVNSWAQTNTPVGLHVRRNEVHDAPYCGIIIGGERLLVEGNLVHRVMREMHDGGGIYGNAKHSVVRGNVVRDVVKNGDGFGVSAYYLYEGSEDTVIERNVSLGIERPTHNHITSRIILRDNVFVADTNMTLSFQRSSGATFSNNIVFAPGKISVNPPNAVKVWTNNLVIREGLDKGGAPQAFTIEDAMPPMPPPARRTKPIEAVRIATPPTLDGEIGQEEWPAMVTLDREPSRWTAGGAPAYARIAYDERCLYVAVNVVVFDVTQLQKNSTWGRDDGAEICIAGTSGTFVIRGFAGGSVQSVTDGGVSAAAADCLGKAVRFMAKPYGSKKGDWKSGWRGEWAIPFEALGLKPASGQKVGFNIGVYRAQDDRRLCLEGTLAESWRLDQAATLQFR